MFNTWRVAQKTLYVFPPSLRETLGSATAWVMLPLDAGLCRAGVTRGINLELAAFLRRG